MNKPKLIDLPFAFLLFVSGMLAVYAYFILVWDPAADEPGANASEIELVPESELALTDLSSLLDDRGPAEAGEEGTPKRRFATNFPPLPVELPSHADGLNSDAGDVGTSVSQELQEKMPLPASENLSIEGAPATSTMPMLNFIGVDPKFRNMELPIGELEALDAFPKMANGAVEVSNSPPVVIDDSGASLHKHFYNLPIAGKKVLFLLEAVPGMVENQEAYTIGLEHELRRVIDSLDEGVVFNLLVFWGEKIAVCNRDYMPANSGNKAYSIVWLKSYFNIDKDSFKEENKPDGYPGMYSSQSGLDWASPLFLAVENRPDSIYLMSSSWRGATKLQSDVPSSLQWTDEKSEAWESALKETELWIDEENERRVLQGLPPRPIFNINQIVARRHPDVQMPPALPRFHEGKIYDELKKRFLEFGVMNKCALYIVVHSGFGRTAGEDMQKFRSLVLPYNGETYLVK